MTPLEEAREKERLTYTNLAKIEKIRELHRDNLTDEAIDVLNFLEKESLESLKVAEKVTQKYTVKVCAISDIHGNLPDLPECDLLLIGGDIFPLPIQHDSVHCLDWLRLDFKYWLKRQKFKECLVIAGNHDFLMERSPEKVKIIFDEYRIKDINAYYLHNELHTVKLKKQEITVFGTPYCHKFGNWAFMPSYDTLEKKFDKIPDKVDIILSHDAPYGITDVCFEGSSSKEGNIGNLPLRERINQVDFKYLLHGHLHSSDHEFNSMNTPNGTALVANVSLLNENYKLAYEPLIFNYEP